MATDGLFLAPAARLNRSGVPFTAMVMQAVWAGALTLSGSYNQLLDYVMFAALLFYVLTVAAVPILRWRRPDLPRPVKAPGYPVVPVLYLVGSLAIMAALLVYRPAFTWPGLILVALGWPLYLLRGKTTTRVPEEAATEA